MTALPALDAGEALTSASGMSAGDLGTLLTRLDRTLTALEPALAMARQAPNMIATAVDTMDDLIAAGRRHGIDVDQRLRDSLRILERLTQPSVMRQLEILLDRLPALEALFPLLDALPAAVTSAQERATPVGPLGVLSALRDPAVQRTVGFGLAAARALGNSPAVGGHRA